MKTQFAAVSSPGGVFPFTAKTIEAAKLLAEQLFNSPDMPDSVFVAKIKIRKKPLFKRTKKGRKK